MKHANRLATNDMQTIHSWMHDRLRAGFSFHTEQTPGEVERNIYSALSNIANTLSGGTEKVVLWTANKLICYRFVNWNYLTTDVNSFEMVWNGEKLEIHNVRQDTSVSLNAGSVWALKHLCDAITHQLEQREICGGECDG